MKIIILKLIIIIWISLAIVIIIGAKNKNLGKRLIYTEKNVGDLYMLSRLNLFKEEIIQLNPKEDTSIENADIITAGDSFFNVANDSDTYSNILESKIELEVYNLLKSNYSKIGNPAKLLVAEGYNTFNKKTLILQTIERGAFFYGLEYYTEELNIPLRSDFIRKKNLFFGNKKMTHLFTRTFFTYYLDKFVKFLRFNILQEIDVNIGEYSIENKMLFHTKGTKFYYEKKNKKVMRKAIQFIVELKNELKEKYDIDMVFMIIPDKFSIYNDYVPNSTEYDNFIPIFQKKLHEAGVKFIDIFSQYVKYRENDDSELLYYGSDSHYTPLGKQIAVDETIKFLTKNRIIETN